MTNIINKISNSLINKKQINMTVLEFSLLTDDEINELNEKLYDVDGDYVICRTLDRGDNEILTFGTDYFHCLNPSEKIYVYYAKVFVHNLYYQSTVPNTKFKIKKMTVKKAKKDLIWDTSYEIPYNEWFIYKFHINAKNDKFQRWLIKNE